MTRVYVVVEGQTERAFVRNVLAPALANSGVYVTARELGVPGHKGGRVSLVRVEKDVSNLLRQDRGVWCSTMLDFYGLSSEFFELPNATVHAKAPVHEKALAVECALSGYMQSRHDIRPGRFLPYIQMHEFEGLLFASPADMAKHTDPTLESDFQMIANEFDSPEEIDQGNETHPSRRIQRLYPRYKKELHGPLIAQEAGLDLLMKKCEHFRHWVDSLKAIAKRTDA